ncbi:MAG: thiamine phosphate synthase [Rhodothermales bacterium]
MTVGRLHILTDFFFQQRFPHEELARRAIAGGADTIQFRQKTGGIRHKLYSASRTAEVCREAGVPLLIDDHIELFLATEAAGVHVGQTDLPVGLVRRILGDAAIIGATANTTRQALEAEEAGASYIGFGPVFPTQSKDNPASLRGLDGLADVCARVRIPVIAIAGITVDRVRDVLEAGAHGVAVMTAVTNAPDPEASTRGFRAAIDRWIADTVHA